MKSEINLVAPVAYDIKHLYPKEFALGKQALVMLAEQICISLPEHEAVSIALHLINAETENGSLQNFITMMQIFEETDHIIENTLNLKLDKENYSYSRFATHMRYLIQRLQTNTQTQNQVNSMCRTLIREHPDVYVCAFNITEYFKSAWGWECNEDEMVYLMLHIHRVKHRT